MPKISYKHPMVQEYQDKYKKRTEKNENSELSKSDVKKTLLSNLGMEERFAWFSPSIKKDSTLESPEKRKILLDHLEKCNIVLNDKKYVDLRFNLLNETILILKSVFPEPKFNDGEYFRMAEDIHYLISHRDEKHSDSFPRNAQSLKDALKTDLPPNGDNAPKSLELIQAEVMGEYEKEISEVAGLSQPLYEQVQREININLPPDQHLSHKEVELIVQRVKSINPRNFPIFLSKSVTKLSHSILIDKDENGYTVLIKPAVKNDQTHVNKRKGTSKDVKTSGVQIEFDINKNLTAVKRIVTVSRQPAPPESRNLAFKDKSLEHKMGGDLIADGFTKVGFIDHLGQLRVIYTKPYLGEDLLFLKGTLDSRTKFEIAEQLLEAFNWSIGDIKLENTLWDGEKATFIDTRDMLFTFTTRHDLYKGVYSRASAQQINKQQIFGLCCLLYDLFAAKDHRLSGHGFKEPSKINKNINLDRNLPFAQFVERTYNETVEPAMELLELKLYFESLKKSTVVHEE